MKRIAICGIVTFLLSVAAVQAQAPTQDWHPNIAEDNKAATLQDTTTFITDTINHNPTNFLITVPGGHLYDNIWITAHAEMGEACHLKIDKYMAAYWGRGHEHQHDEIDISGVDPLSIDVESHDYAHDSKHFTPGFVIIFSGTNSKNIVDWRAWHFHDDFAWNTDTTPATTLFTCEGKEKHCSETNGQRPKEYIWLNDSEVAKRLARALLHASVLCGGTKAVSPF